MASVQYRFRIYSTDDTTVETTFQAQLESWDSVGGQEVRPLEGRAETRPWSVRVVDYSTAVTNDLADSSGRLRRIGRLADFQQNLDSSGWATLGTGRISDVLLTEAVASYQFVMEDEHYLARQQLIFNSTSHDPTCYLYPPGLRSKWLGLNARQTGRAKIFVRAGNLSVVFFDSTASVSAIAMRELEQDLAASTAGSAYSQNSTRGNFKFLRFHGGGADYEVFALGSGRTGDGVVDHISAIRLPPEEQVPLPVIVVDPSTALGTSGNAITGAYLYSPGAPPTPGQPWHIGGADGQHPYAIIRDIYDSSYGGRSIRYDSTAFTNAINNKLFPQVGFQITSPRGMAEFTERTLYAPFGGIPFVSRDGRIMPRSIFLPSTAEVDQDTLFEFTGANLRPPHPTWEHTRGQMVTVLELPAFSAYSLSDREVKAKAYEVPADFINIIGYAVAPAEFTGLFQFTRSAMYAPPLEHDRLGIGRITHRIENEAITKLDAPNWSWRHIVAREVFDRFGDGPIQGQLYALSSGTSGVLPGDFVKLTLATYPNVGIQGRGNTRILQILSGMETPHGPVFDYLDAGPNSTVLATPTVTLTSGTVVPKHEIIVTLGTIPTDGSVELQIAQGSASPSTNSSAWEQAIPLSLTATSGSYTIPARKSGTTWWARARATKLGRWRSAWTYSTAGAQTEALTAASAVVTTGYTQDTANVSWTNSTASTGYDLEMAYDFTPASTGIVTGTRTVDRIPAGSDHYQLRGITGSTVGGNYAARVRYFDLFGGVSSYAASANFSLTTTPPVADNWSTSSTAVQLVYGVNTTAEVY